MPTLYARLGGEPAVNAAVELFYDKILADDRVNRFFEGVDMRFQTAKLKRFLTSAFDSRPETYSGLDMNAAHAPLVRRGLNDSHFDAILEHLPAALTELGVPDDLMVEAVQIAESVRGDILGRRGRTLSA